MYTTSKCVSVAVEEKLIINPQAGGQRGSLVRVGDSRPLGVA